jgi:pimeloyl-ACP methyl ester carboxylesterase
MRCRVELWYGDADTIVPLQMGRHLAHTIPAGRLHILPGEGHMAYLTHWADILRALIR